MSRLRCSDCLDEALRCFTSQKWLFVHWSDFCDILSSYTFLIPWNYVIWTHLHLYHQLVLRSEYFFSEYVSNLGSAGTLAQYGDAPGKSKRFNASFSWLSILTNLEYKSLFTFTSNKIKHVHQYLYQARTFRVTCARARKHEKTIKQHSISKWIHRNNPKNTLVDLLQCCLMTHWFHPTVFQKILQHFGGKSLPPCLRRVNDVLRSLKSSLSILDFSVNFVNFLRINKLSKLLCAHL